MRHFPIFVDLRGKSVVVSGAGEAAVAKLRLLLKTQATIIVIGPNPVAQVLNWAHDGLLTLHIRPFNDRDADGATLVYGANEDATEDARALTIAKAAGAMTNIVDNLDDSDFITPAIVDRDPVTIAIGTEGAAPVLARQIKADLEATLSPTIGILTRLGQAFRPTANTLPHGLIRRAFWSRFYLHTGPIALASGGEEAVQNELNRLLEETKTHTPKPGFVHIVGAGPGDPELLTLKARRLLHQADVVIHDRLVPAEILELARREAHIVETGKQGFGAAWKQSDINALLVSSAQNGAQVVRLKSGDPAIFARLDEEMDALDAAGIGFALVPGITAASAAAASLNVSLTQRGRNSSLRLLTGHDIDGFAEHDWKSLAKPGAVAAIYMGAQAASFLRGRLLIHGAAESTPITAIENASRPDQRILTCDLIDLPETLAEAHLTGPVLLFLGLAPRSAAALATDLDLSEAL